jgi:hypothetical protein
VRNVEFHVPEWQGRKGVGGRHFGLETAADDDEDEGASDREYETGDLYTPFYQSVRSLDGFVAEFVNYCVPLGLHVRECLINLFWV